MAELKKKRKYTMSPEAIEARKNSGFGARKGDINTSGKGGFKDNPQNIYRPKKHLIRDDWWNSYRMCLLTFSEIDLDTFWYLCGKYQITQETMLTAKIQRNLDELYADPDAPRGLTNIVDNCLRWLVRAKDPKDGWKVSKTIMENIEGKAVQRTESKVASTNIKTDTMVALEDENRQLRLQLEASMLADLEDDRDIIEQDDVIEINFDELEEEDDEETL